MPTNNPTPNTVIKKHLLTGCDAKTALMELKKLTDEDKAELAAGILNGTWSY